MEYRSIHDSLCIFPKIRYELEIVVGGQSEVDCYMKNSSLTADGFRRLTAIGETDDLADYVERDSSQSHDTPVRFNGHSFTCFVYSECPDI